VNSFLSVLDHISANYGYFCLYQYIQFSSSDGPLYYCVTETFDAPYYPSSKPPAPRSMPLPSLSSRLYSGSRKREWIGRVCLWESEPDFHEARIRVRVAGYVSPSHACTAESRSWSRKQFNTLGCSMRHISEWKVKANCVQRVTSWSQEEEIGLCTNRQVYSVQ